MTEVVRDTRIARVRNRLFASVGMRAVAYPAIAVGSHMAAAEQGNLDTSSKVGLGIAAGSVLASIVERRLAHRACAAIVKEGGQDRDFTGVGELHIGSGKFDQALGSIVGMGLAPFTALLTVTRARGVETVPQNVAVAAEYFGMIGVIGIIGGLAMDAFAVRESGDGYTRQIEAQQPLVQEPAA